MSLPIKNKDKMKRKKIIAIVSFSLQILFLLGIFIGFYLGEYLGKSDFEALSVISFVGFTLTQILSAVLMLVVFKEQRFKPYLKSIFSIQIMCTLVSLLCVALGTVIEIVSYVGLAGCFLALFIAPIVQAIWCLMLNWQLATEEDGL